MPRSKDVLVDGVSVKLVWRKGMKNVRLRVDDAGQCIVSTHPGISEEKMLSYVHEKIDWVKKCQNDRLDTPTYRAAHASKDDVAAWRDVVSACVPVLIETWEPVLGVKAGKLAYRNMTSKWGSCQPGTGRICINVRLALYPPECLEYVVVHELCHLRHANHGPEFWGLMDKVMPDWRVRQNKLRS